MSIERRKRAGVRAELMSAYEAYQRREPASMDKLLMVVRKFAYMKLYHLEHDFKDFGSAETVDDWTQDVSIRVWQSLLKNDNRTPASFYAWVHKIAFNKGNASFNKLAAERATAVPLFVNSTLVRLGQAGDGDPEDDHQEENPALQEEGHSNPSVCIPKSVQGVDLTICKLLLTKVVGAEDGKERGRTYADVGFVLGMTENAVKKRLQKLRSRLRAERESGEAHS